MNSLFKSNVALDGGGAIFSQGNVIVTNSEFQSNSLVSLENQRLTGGAIWSIDTVRVHNSKFISNSAIAGGAIYSTNALIFDSEFELNLAKGTGGGCFWR
jgi:predicted outer membrane repeat protein